jgi:hypothetical protein
MQTSLFSAGAIRGLHADATSTAVSTGGLASSTTVSAGDSTLATTSVAADGGTAVAKQSANEGNHTKLVVAVGGTVMELEYHEPAKRSPTWQDAPECPFAPTGRLLVR